MDRRTFLARAAGTLAAVRLHAGFPHNSAIGANTAIHGFGMLEAIALIGELGFPAIEIHAMGVPEPVGEEFPGYTFPNLSTSQKQRIRAALRGFDKVTVHLPYHGLHYFSQDAAAARESAGKVEAGLDGAGYFGASLAVVHPIPPTGFTDEEGRKVMMERFHHWGDLGQKHKIQLALETGYPRSVQSFVALVKNVDHPWVGATLDVGHQGQYAELTARVQPGQRGTREGIRAYNDTNIALVDQLRDKLFHLHVHDIDPLTWKEHQPFGTGFIDYPRLIAKLRATGYGGLLMLEIGAPAPQMRGHLALAKKRLEEYLRA